MSANTLKDIVVQWGGDGAPPYDIASAIYVGQRAPKYLDESGNPIQDSRFIKVNIVGEDAVYFPPHTPQFVLDRELPRHMQGPWSERRQLLGTSLAFWAVPLAAAYALGWGLAWVRKGFAGRPKPVKDPVT